MTLSIGYGYTSADLTSLTTPSGQVIGYSYNANHQITAITVNGSTLLASITYEPFGPVSGWTWGNATSTVRTYEADGSTTTVSNGGESVTYGLDNASRITSATNAANNNLSWTYGYDAVDRLTSANSTPETDTFTYDANGNRLTQGGTQSSNFTPASSSNRIASSTGYFFGTMGHDAPGNVNSVDQGTFDYNAAGRIVPVHAHDAATVQPSTPPE